MNPSKFPFKTDIIAKGGMTAEKLRDHPMLHEAIEMKPDVIVHEYAITEIVFRPTLFNFKVIVNFIYIYIYIFISLKFYEKHFLLYNNLTLFSSKYSPKRLQIAFKML